MGRHDVEGRDEVDMEASSGGTWKLWIKSLSNEDKSLLSTWRGGAVWNSDASAQLLVRPSPELQVVWRSPSKCKTLVGRVQRHRGPTAGAQSGIRSANVLVVQAASY